MGAALKIRTDPTSRAQLQRLARRERSPRTAPQLLAIASALEGESQTEAARLAALFRGPDPARDGGVDWTLPALCGSLEGRFGKRLHPASLSRGIRRLELARQKTRPLHPEADERAKAAYVKGGCCAP